MAPGLIDDPEKEFFEWAPKLDPLASPTLWARFEVLSIIYMYLARGYISGDCVKRIIISISPTAQRLIFGY